MVSIAQFTQFNKDSHLENFGNNKATYPIRIGRFLLCRTNILFKEPQTIKIYFPRSLIVLVLLQLFRKMTHLMTTN